MRKPRGDSSPLDFLSVWTFPSCSFIFIRLLPPSGRLLENLYLNVNCNCFDTVCSFSDLSCNIALYSGYRIRKEHFQLYIFSCFFFFLLLFTVTFSHPIFCAQLFSRWDFVSAQFGPDLIQQEINKERQREAYRLVSIGDLFLPYQKALMLLLHNVNLLRKKNLARPSINVSMVIYVTISCFSLASPVLILSRFPADLRR